MNIEACYYLGYTSKIYGKNGEIAIQLDTDSPENYKNLESVFIQINKKDKMLIPFFISTRKLQHKNILVVKLEGIDNVVSAKEMVGKSIYLPLDLLPKLKGKHFYFHEVIGFEVIDQTKGNIGKINQVLEFPQQSIFEIINEDKKEILIPIHDEIVCNLDRENKTIIINAPDGLIDIYLT